MKPTSVGLLSVIALVLSLVLLDSLIYSTAFDPAVTGMEVFAFDPFRGERIWSSKLYGLGPIGHSVYENWGGTLEVCGSYLVVCGKESAGNYTEVIELSTGRTVANLTIVHF